MCASSQAKDAVLSLAQLLDGSISILLALEAGTNLAVEEMRQNGGKLDALLRTASPGQRQAVELIQLAEMQLLAGAYAAARQTMQRLFPLLQDYHKQRGSSPLQLVLLRRIHARVLEDTADFLAARGVNEEALACYAEAALRDPHNGELIKKQGRLHYRSGINGLAEAERLMHRAVELNPRDLENYEDLGRVLEARGDRQKDALFIYREAMSYCRSDMQHIRIYLRLAGLYPGDNNVARRLGNLYRRIGIYSEARRCLEEAWQQSGDHWTALDLAWLCLLTGDTHRGAELIKLGESSFNTNVKEDGSTRGEAFRWTKNYLEGLLREEEGAAEAARASYRSVEPASSVYWPAQLGLARLALYEGDYGAVEKTLRSIPELQRSELEREYFEICRLMEETVATAQPLQAALWREHRGETDPHYQLKSDIYSRSMGPSFWRKYEILDMIGDGPVSQVYLGRERATGKKVAIKMVQVEFLSDPLCVRRLQGRLKTMANLRHPGLLVPAADCYYNGDLYYVMEYAEGGSLTSLIRQAPLNPLFIIEIALQICQALHYLYRQQKAYFHGALKPENILLDEAGLCRISDFDLLETATGSKTYPAGFTREPSLYRRTFLYAAPERFRWKKSLFSLITARRPQAESPEMALEGVDHRADLYSLGVILYELAAGFLPQQKTDLRSLRAYHRSTTIPSARLLNPAIPLELDQMIGGLLQKDPQRRFSTPVEVMEKLKRLG